MDASAEPGPQLPAHGPLAKWIYIPRPGNKGKIPTESAHFLILVNRKLMVSSYIQTFKAKRLH